MHENAVAEIVVHAEGVVADVTDSGTTAEMVEITVDDFGSFCGAVNDGVGG